MQFGGGRMGGVALSAGGLVTQNFQNIPDGPIEKLYLEVSFSAKSSAAAFNAVVDTEGAAAAEAVDDLDLILNALFASLTMYWDPGNVAFAGLTPAQLRTVLGLFNQRDFDGTFLNAVSIPISSGSATAFKVTIPIPVSLRTYFEDGNIFTNGSARLKKGQIDYNAGSSLTPSVVCANGTAAISAVSVQLYAEHGAGTPNDIGQTWRVTRQANLPTVYEFSAGMRLGLLQTTAVASNAASAINVGNIELWSPVQFGAKYQSERLINGGFDITARVTPLVWIEASRKFLDFAAHLGRTLKVDAVSGLTSITVYDIVAMPPPPSVVAMVSTAVGGGGAVNITHPNPASIPAGIPIPAELAALLPIRVNPGALATPGATRAETPVVAAQQQVQRDMTTQRAAGFLSLFGGRK